MTSTARTHTHAVYGVQLGYDTCDAWHVHMPSIEHPLLLLCLWSGSGSLPVPCTALPCSVLTCGTDDAESLKPRSFLSFRGVLSPTASIPALTAQRACIVNVRSANEVDGAEGGDDFATKQDGVICSGPPIRLACTSSVAPDSFVSMRTAGPTAID